MEGGKDLRRGVEILNVVVDIGHGQQDILRVCENDDLRLIVRGFFIRNNITDHSEAVFLQRVNEYLEELAEEHRIITMAVAHRPNLPETKCRNFGERLYRRSMQEKEEFLLKNQMIRLKSAKELQGSLNFKPKINKNSVKIASSITSRVSTVSSPPAQSSSEFTFTPKINENSNKLVKKQPNRIEELYEDAKTRDKKLKALTQKAKTTEFPFHPTTNSKPRNSNPEELIDRLINSQKERNENLNKLKTALQIEIDPQTGQKFFTPMTGRAPDYQREGSVWDQLYSHQRVPSEPTLEYPYSPVKLDSKLQTEKILLKKKINRYSEIFKLLKPNAKHEVCFELIDFKALDANLGKVLYPLMKELEEAKLPLNFEDFCESMDNLLKSLTPIDKNTVIFKEIKAAAPKPVKKLHRKSQSTANMQSRELQASESKASRLELERLKAEKAATMYCTFRPSINSYNSPNKKK